MNQQNLVFRSFGENDVSALVSILNQSQVTRYITDAIAQPYTVSDAESWVAHSHSSELIKAIEVNGQLAGCIAATPGHFEYRLSAELGYWLDPAYWNQGIGTEVVAQFSQWLFEHKGFVRLFVSVVAENQASVRVLEKNGFLLEGVLKKASFKNGQFYDEKLLSKIR